MRPDQPMTLWTRMKRAALGFDAWLNSTLFEGGRGLGDVWEGYSRHGQPPARARRAAARRARPDERGDDARARGRHRDARPRHPGLPGDERRLAEDAGTRRHLPRPLRAGDRPPRHPARRFLQARGVPRLPRQGGARDGGPALLRALGHRPDRHLPGARPSTRAAAASCRAAPRSPSSSPRTCS